MISQSLFSCECYNPQRLKNTEAVSDTLKGYTLHTGVCPADKRHTCLFWSAPPSAMGGSGGHVDGGGDSHVLGFPNVPKPAASCVSVWNPKQALSKRVRAYKYVCCILCDNGKRKICLGSRTPKSSVVFSSRGIQSFLSNNNF